MQKKDLIIEKLKQGLAYSQISKDVKCTKATISYHAKKIGLSKGRIFHYNWDKVQKYLDRGYRRFEVVRIFGMSRSAWAKAKERGKIRVGEWRIPLANLLVKDCKVNRRGYIKALLLKGGVLKNQCSLCGIKKWRGRDIVCRLDHINGVNNDNRLLNLRMVCPNCDSQLETFAGRNVKKKPNIDE